MKETTSKLLNDHLKSEEFQAGVILIKVELFLPANGLLKQSLALFVNKGFCFVGKKIRLNKYLRTVF